MKNTKISWCDHTFNPWIGCTKVSPACDNCYAEQIASRFKMAQWGNHKRVLTSEKNWKQPLRWNKQAIKEGKRFKVFCGSMCDVFDNQAPFAWRLQLFTLIQNTPSLDWLLLTKRIGNAKKMLDNIMWFHKINGHLDNVCLGITVCNQEEADRDIPKLLSIPAAKHFLSIEPMLGYVDLSKWLKPQCDNGSIPSIDGTYGVMCPRCQGNGPSCSGIDWVIVGGETGRNARYLHPECVRVIRDQCKATGTAFFFKQWGEYVPYEWHAQPPYIYSQHGDLFDAHGLPDFESDEPKNGWLCDDTNEVFFRRVGEKKAGYLLDCVEYQEVPA